MQSKYSDIANRAPNLYTQTAPTVLGKIHEELRKTVQKHTPLETLVIIGPGENVLPFSRQYNKSQLGDTNRDWVRSLFQKKGNFILVDCVSEKNHGLQRARETLRENGFFQPGYFTENERIIEGELTEYPVCDTPQVVYIKANLCNQVLLPPQQADCIDMTLSMHHATKTRARLRNICRDCFNFLKPGGILHIAEGNVDMNYIEERLVQIGQDISTITAQPVLVIDSRGTIHEGLEEKIIQGSKTPISSPQPLFFYFTPGQTYKELPEITHITTEHHQHINIFVSVGGITIPYEGLRKSNKLRDTLNTLFRNYPKIEPMSDGMWFPLVDPEKHEDRMKFLRPVKQFYNKLIIKANDIKDKDVSTRLISEIEEEKERAIQGDTEHYISRRKIVRELRKTMFENIHITSHRGNPFYNLTAMKPQ